MKWPIVVLVSAAALFTLASCSQRARTPSARERADRLNSAKTRASDLLQAGQHHRALEVLEPLTEEASGDHQVFVMYGDAHAGLGDWQAAVRAYESAIRLAYSDHEAHLKLATLLMNHGRVGRALTEFELAIRYGDRQPLTHYNYGLALRAMGRHDEALDEWRLAHDMDAKNPLYAEAMGIGLTGVDDKEAVAHFEEALVLGANSASFNNNYGLALQRLGRYDEAEERFVAATSADGDREEYAFNLAALFMRAGRYEEAAAAWQEMIAKWGARWSYVVYLARAQYELGLYEDAILNLESIALAHANGEATEAMDRVPPTLDEASEILALASRGKGDLAAALEHIRKAVELAPDNLVYRNNYGVILAESGMLAEAKAQWRKVLENDEDNATARENLSRFGP